MVQVTSPRIPCVTFQSWMDEPHWVKRFAAAGRPGAYLRVLAEGTVGAGDEAQVSTARRSGSRSPSRCAPTTATMDLMRRVLRVPGRGDKWDEIGQHVLGRARV